MSKEKFIGRLPELEQLKKCFEEAKSGKGKLILVEGESGIGKSAVVREFILNEKNANNSVSSISECNDKDSLNAYAPFKEVLIQLNSEITTKGGNLKKLKKFISEAGTGWIGLIPVVGSFAATGIETYKKYKETYKSEPQISIENIQDVYKVFENELRRLAKEKILIIFLDDIQWADSSSLNLLFALGRAIRINPFNILLIASYRPAEIKAGRSKISETGKSVIVRHPFADKLNELRNYVKKENHLDADWFKEIKLKPFSKQEVKELIDTKFFNNSFKNDFYNKLYNLTNGLPLFLVELLEYFKRNSIIEENNGVYTSQIIKIDELPLSLNGMISEKIERLNDELRKVLTYASIFGEEFTIQIVEHILNIDEDQLFDYLDELALKYKIIEEKDEHIFGDMFAFSQTLTHRFIYKNTSNARRKSLHRKIAKYIKENFGNHIEDNKEVRDTYNYHNQIGQGLIDAFTYEINSLNEIQTNEEIKENKEIDSIFLEAAELEIKKAKESLYQFASNETLEYVDKGLAFLSKVDEKNKSKFKLKSDALSFRSEAQKNLGSYKKSIDTALLLLNLEKQYYKNDNDEIASTYNHLGTLYFVLENFENAKLFYKKALEIKAQCLGNEHLDLSRIYNNLGRLHKVLGDYEMASDCYRKSENILNNYSENVKDRGVLYNDLAALYILWDNYKLAEEYYFKVISISKHIEQFIIKDNLAIAYRGLGDICLEKHNSKKALSYYTKTKSIYFEIYGQNHPQTAVIFSCFGRAYQQLKEFEKALEYNFKALNIELKFFGEDSLWVSTSFNNIATVYGENNELEKAIEYNLKSLKLKEKILGEKHIDTATAYSNAAFYYKANKDYEVALDYYLKALEIRQEKLGKHHNSIGLTFENIADLLAEVGDYENAIGFCFEALTVFEKVEGKESKKVASLNFDIAKYFFYLENYEKALDYYLAAFEMYKKIKIDDIEEMDSFFKAEIGVTYFKLQQFEKAILFLKQSLKLNKTEGNRKFEAYKFFYLGKSYLKVANYNSAIENLVMSKKVYGTLDGTFLDEIDRINFELAKCYLKTKVEVKAKELLLKSLIYREATFGVESKEYIEAKDLIKINNG